MARKLTATMSNWVFDELIEDGRPKGMNRSEWIEELVIKGIKYIKGPKYSLPFPITS